MKKVTVLLSTYNGEKYLKEQIDSLINQKDVELNILVRDDGSTDSTQSMLDKYQDEKILTWYAGGNKRSARSFMDLVNNAPVSDYYAFCDQDDVWNKNKLSIGINILENIENDNVPKLYCSNYQLVDEKLNPLPDNEHVSTITFNAAIVSSCCTGCTAIFNRKLLDILKKDIPKNLVMHDDWVHKVCLAVGGIVYYDENKTLKYRQHENNVDGGVHTLKNRLKKIFSRIKSKDCIRSNQLKDLLNIYENQMSKENIDLLNKIVNYRTYSFFKRMKLAFSKEITTPYPRLNRGFRFAIVFKYF